jgi:hypothetical protein
VRPDEICSPDLAADVADRDAAGDLLQDRRDLLDGDTLLLYGTTSWADEPDCAAKLALKLNSEIGSPSPDLLS